MKKLRSMLTITGFSLMFAGCITRGEHFSSELGWVKAGATKKSDVKLMLGNPFAVGNSSGIKTWTYGYYYYSLLGTTHVKEVKFYWKPNGSVDRFVFTSSLPEDIAKSQ